jgi:hypothetical protein
MMWRRLLALQHTLPAATQPMCFNISRCSHMLKLLHVLVTDVTDAAPIFEC